MLAASLRTLVLGVLLLALGPPEVARAAKPEDPAELHVGVGFGYVTPAEDLPGSGDGVFVQAQYVLPEYNWVRLVFGRSLGEHRGRFVRPARGRLPRFGAPVPAGRSKGPADGADPVHQKPDIEVAGGASAGDIAIQSGVAVAARDRG